ncbi:MAG: YciI family protein [Myxococcales bacterium]|nr:YciI family protein [Myxococcales bacterium]
MKYMLLIYTDHDADAARSEANQKALINRYFTYTEELKSAGVFIAGDALELVNTATSVRVRDGKTLSTDGPFAETKEQLGGFYMIDCEDLDAAIKWAAKLPAADHGTVEVRPIWNYSVEG